MIGVRLKQKSPNEIHVRIKADSPANNTGAEINRICLYEDGFIINRMDDGTDSEIKFLDVDGVTIDRALTTHDETTFYRDLLTHLKRIYKRKVGEE